MKNKSKKNPNFFFFIGRNLNQNSTEMCLRLHIKRFNHNCFRLCVEVNTTKIFRSKDKNHTVININLILYTNK